MRRLLVLGLFALLSACAVEIDDPESGEVRDTNTELVEGEGAVQPSAVEQGGPADPEIVSPEERDPDGPTPDPWAAGPSGGPTPDPWVIPEPQKKTAH